MEPIRVLHVIGVMDRGGAETLIMNLYRAIDRTKVQFDFVESNTGTAVFDNEILEMGGRIYHSPRFSAKNIAKYIKWWNEFFRQHKNEYEVVHGHLGSTAAIYLGIAKKYGLYTIAHSHNSNAKMSLKIAAYHVFSYPTRYIADHFFACSMQAGIDRYGKRTASGKKTELLNNAIDTERFMYSAEAAQTIRKALGAGENTLVIGHVGRFAEAKNHSFLIDVFKAVHEKHPDSILAMVGAGELRESIEEKVKRENLEDAARFVGLKSNVYDYMSAMDVLVFPSIYEGLPVTLVEAQASGLPCLISDRIPKDSCLVPELIKIRSLEESTEKWADTAVSMKSYQNRQIYAQKVKEAGFDSAENARKLMNFYLEKSVEVKHSRGQNV